MTPEDRSKLSASMFAQHAEDMANIGKRGAEQTAKWAETGASIARTLAAREVRGVPDLAEMLAAGTVLDKEPTREA
jgi:hypothetical protein